MGTFRLVSTNELRTRRKLSPQDLALFDQFKGYLSKLDADCAGIYEFSPNDDRAASITLLKRAAKALNQKIRINKDDSSVAFYLRRTRKSRGARKAVV